ncbi:MAG: type I-E CRISPR-associated endonuclease Cas1e [Actinomycetaceae bacterium]|nr:type I-E CRISPR-associated endonuclease Cas1e [Actinomycetaceae bacterium]
MWWLANPHSLHRVSDRISTVYVEMCHIDRADNAVVFINKERTVRLPAAYVGAIMLGPGTRITHGAVRLLADSGTSVCWVGEHGVRMYASGLGTSRSSGLAVKQARLVSHETLRVGVARRMYQMRFPGEDVSQCSMQQLRGREGARIRKVYADFSRETGIPWQGRRYKAGDAFAEGDPVNRLLSAAHSCLYAACHAAIVGVGAVPSLGFVHSGGALSFVHDIADLYKADYSIPLAFTLAAAGQIDESDARYGMRQRFKDGHFMKQVVKDVVGLLSEGADGDEASFEDAQHSDASNVLWDEDGGVDSGVDWSTNQDFLELRRHGFLAVSGPDVAGVSEESL